MNKNQTELVSLWELRCRLLEIRLKAADALSEVAVKMAQELVEMVDEARQANGGKPALLGTRALVDEWEGCWSAYENIAVAQFEEGLKELQELQESDQV